MNECKSTADIVELMSRIVIVVDCSAEGQKKKRPAATDRKKKEINESGHEQLTAKKICRFFA